MHLKRWLTAAVAVPLLVVLIYFAADWVFGGVIALVAIVALYEYYRIVLPDAAGPGLLVTRLSGFLAAALVVLAGVPGRFDIICLAACGLFVFSGACALSAYKDKPTVFDTVVKQVTGLIYLPFSLSLAVMVYSGSYGATWIFLLLIIVFLGDTGAYYAGTYLGKHKLLPAVSPGKTVQGAAGGLLATVLAGCLINFWLPGLPWQLDMPRLPWGMALLFFVIVSICGQLGDLFESVMKRDAGVKDSGVLFPGHGGLLDRIDAVLFAIPVVYLFKAYVFCL